MTVSFWSIFSNFLNWLYSIFLIKYFLHSFLRSLLFFLVIYYNFVLFSISKSKSRAQNLLVQNDLWINTRLTPAVIRTLGPSLFAATILLVASLLTVASLPYEEPFWETNKFISEGNLIYLNGLLYNELSDLSMVIVIKTVSTSAARTTLAICLKTRAM